MRKEKFLLSFIIFCFVFIISYGVDFFLFFFSVVDVVVVIHHHHYHHLPRAVWQLLQRVI